MKPPPHLVAPPRDDAELSALLDVLARVFNFPREYANHYVEHLGRENMRVLRADGVVAGGLAQLPMAQYYGGRSVPMAGIAVVGVSPAARSSGGATALMRATLEDLRARRIALSVLYPATVPLYRRVGYEFAGSRYEIRLILRQLHLRDRGHAIRPITDADAAAVEAIYEKHARNTAGFIDRSAFIWRRVRAPRWEPAEGYLAVNPATGEAEGYVYYQRKESPEAAYLLQLSDIVALTPAAGRRLLSFLADHRSMADLAIYAGSACNPLIRLLPDRASPVRLFDHWMLRLVDLERALEERGYPAGLAAEIHLEVADDVLAANSGRMVLTVTDGRGSVREGGRGEIRVDIRGLAALYTGHATPWEVAAAGQLTAIAEAPLALLAAAFAGPAPAMPDFF